MSLALCDVLLNIHLNLECCNNEIYFDILLTDVAGLCIFDLEALQHNHKKGIHMTDLERANAAIKRQIKMLQEVDKRAGIKPLTVADTILLEHIKKSEAKS